MIASIVLRSAFLKAYGPLPERREAAGGGLVLLADGVGGLHLCALGLQYAAAWEDLPHEIRVLNWGHGPWRWYADLTNTANLNAQAAATAEEVEKFRAERPGAPVFLVGKSGGSGIVARALEALPAGAVEAAVLLAPALSPEYDLSRALRAVRGQVTAFTSPLDGIILGAGTRIFGTIDRVRTRAAGLVGFRVPGGLDADARAQYAKLRQVRWRPSMARAGYFGGHLGVDHPAFLRRHVVPLLRGDAAGL